MAIYQLFDSETEECVEPSRMGEDEQKGGKNQFFSTLVTRLCFFLLFVGDLAWLAYNMSLFILGLVFLLFTGGKVNRIVAMVRKRRLNVCRGAVCALALIVGLVSPPFGIMIACTYFLMYDKAGMESVVPASLQAQFKNLFHPSL